MFVFKILVGITGTVIPFLISIPLCFSAGEKLLAGAVALPITPIDEKGSLWEEPYEDLNGNGRYDAPNPMNPEGFQDRYVDSNENGKWDGPFLAGFHHYGSYYTAKGVHDHIWTRALVLEMGETKIALVALDLVGFFYSYVEEIREAVKDLGFSQVIVASTHTHGGPDSVGLWGPDPFTDGKDPRFIKHIQKQTIRALREANALLQPARVRFAKNRVSTAFGSPINDFRDPIVIDEDLLVMQILNHEERTIATVVNWSPHPETMGGSTSLITSDFPHYLRKGIEEGGFRVGGKRFQGLGGVAIYFSGAVGGLLTTMETDIQDEDGRTLPPSSWAKTRRIGELAAAAALEALNQESLVSLESISVHTKKIFIPLDNLMFRKLSQQGVIKRPTYSKGREVREGEDVLSEVNLVSFNGLKAPVAQMITVPGELFPEIFIGGYLKDSGECWGYSHRKKKLDGRGKERLKASHPGVPREPVLRPEMKGQYRFLIGLGNDELGYIVPANDFVPPKVSPLHMSYGTDRCGDGDHYEETVSASSKMAPIVSHAVLELIQAQGDSRKKP